MVRIVVLFCIDTPQSSMSARMYQLLKTDVKSLPGRLQRDDADRSMFTQIIPDGYSVRFGFGFTVRDFRDFSRSSATGC